MIFQSFNIMSCYDKDEDFVIYLLYKANEVEPIFASESLKRIEDYIRENELFK